MRTLLAKKISNLSKLLKYICLIGIIIFPVLNFLYWILDLPGIRLSTWCIQFSDMPSISVDKLSIKMRWVGFSVDLIPCAIFISILFLLAQLLKQYEHLYFFSKKNARYIRWIALLLFCFVIISPFYAVLRSCIFTPAEQGCAANLFGPNDFKRIVISFGVLLFAYISDAARRLEADLCGLV
jgi:hypothetical protein